MNKNLLNTEVQEFINSSLKVDITTLILKGSPFENISIQELAEQIEAKKRCEKKLPTWFNTRDIIYPNKLNIEQTSSEVTAKFKSELVFGDTLIDLTGGFGIDTYYFSKKVKSITHCEMNDSLSEIVRHNLIQLESKNIEILTGDGLKHLKNKFETDWIYIDPSRRNDIKGKVFLLNDCLPNVPKNLEFIFSKTKNVLIKVSPILDISSAISELKFVKQVYVVAVNNEVKELIFHLEKEFLGQIEIKTVNFNKTETQKFNFIFKENKLTYYKLPQKYLYEPNAAILKAGGFNQISNEYNLNKLHQHSHLFTSNNLIHFPGRI